jgi:hypothetical protein
VGVAAAASEGKVGGRKQQKKAVPTHVKDTSTKKWDDRV